MNPLHSAKTSEWHTPGELIEPARRVLGEIDLDPASSAEANARIGAAVFFSKATNGLTSPWPENCAVLLNPPSRRSGKFWRKLLDYREAGHLRHAVVIVYSIEQLATLQEPLALVHFPLVIARKRIAFLRPDGTRGDHPGHANAVAYVPGTVDRTELFFAEFGDLGVEVNRAA